MTESLAGLLRVFIKPRRTSRLPQGMSAAQVAWCAAKRHLDFRGIAHDAASKSPTWSLGRAAGSPATGGRRTRLMRAAAPATSARMTAYGGPWRAVRRITTIHLAGAEALYCQALTC